MDERAKRIGRNEALFREVNERVKEVTEGFELSLPQVEFVCECGDEGCTGLILMSLEEYERIRADGRTFAVMRGHEIPDVEVVVSEREDHVVVRKLEGGPAELADKLDPRS